MAMDELLNNLTSTYWWLSVVVVGLIINLVSSYLKPPLDAIGSKTFHAWKARSERANKMYVKKVDALAAAPHTQVLFMLRAQSLRAKSNGWSLTAIFALALYQSSVWLGDQSPLHADQTAPFVSTGWALSLIVALSVIASMRLAYAAADLELLVMDAQIRASTPSNMQ